jgi:hypothetical protein
MAEALYGSPLGTTRPCMRPGGMPCSVLEAHPGDTVDHGVSAFTLMVSPHCSWLASTVTQVSVLGRRVCDILLHPLGPLQSQDPPD